MTWRSVHVGFEGDDLRIAGKRVWHLEWRSTGEAAELPHPSYPNQRHRYQVFEAGDPEAPIRFAAAELSNGVWGFYVRG